MSNSDARLMARWHTTGDANSLQQLIERHSAMVYRTCLRVLRNPEDAEEVTQDCFLRLARGAAKPGRPVGAWLHRAAVNRSIDVLRSRKRRDAREDWAALEQAARTQSAAGWDDLALQVDEALAHLPEDLREVIVARFLEGRTQGDIGRELGITRQAVAQRIERGIARLRSHLERRGVVLGVNALPAAMAELGAQATSLPTTLQAALGHLTLAGPTHIAATFTKTGVSTWIAGGMVMKKTILACAAVLAVGLAAYWLAPRRDSAPATSQAGHSAAPSTRGAPEALEILDGSPAEAPSPATPRPETEAVVAPPEDAQGETPRFAFVSGHVRDELGGPVQGADVHLFVLAAGFRSGNEVRAIDELLGTPGRVLETHTDHRGYYEFDEVEQVGQGIVSAHRAGYIGIPTAQGPKRLLAIEPGRRITDFDLALRAGETVHGRVLSPERHPVAHAQVMWLGAFTTATTDTAGAFVIDVADSTKPLDFAVRAEGYSTVSVRNVRPGPDARFEIVLHGFASLAGRIEELDGSPSPGRRIVAEPVGYAGPTETAETGSDGTYAIGNLASTVYRVSVQSAEGKALSRPEELPPLRDGERREWNHTVTAPAVVEGVVTRPRAGSPVPGAYVAWIDGGRSLAGAGTDQLGRYRLELYGAAGPVTLQPFGAPVGEGPVDVGELARFAKTIAATPGEATEVNLELPDGSTMYVRFVDPEGRPIVGANVERHAWNAADPSRNTGYVIGDAPPADADGWYAIPCPHGSACMATLRPADGQPWLQAQSRPFAPQTLGGTYDEEVTVYYKSSLRGRLTGPDGRPLRNTQVPIRITGENGAEQFVYLYTGDDGAFDEQVRAAHGARLEPVQPDDAAPWRWSLEEALDLPPGVQADLGTIQLWQVE